MPRRFEFPLEPVLRYRTHLEEQKKRELAQARRMVMDQNRVLLGLLRDEAAGKGELKALRHEGALDIRRVRLQEQYLNSVGRRIRKEYETLQTRLLDEQKVRRELVEARKQVRVLERLKERRRKAYEYELGREERKMFDEIGINVFRAGQGAAS